ncbi:DUF4423 domain-containing protein [Pseudobacteriovorax antillogorgiicola]|uniref:TIGR02147 family protein n=1 Tax=Pseudobacteriovorax antillogorgiicola TaxID=1513793 RepID=A0A1Y6CI41_9BACT|nr:DUF4423 domain-containing protein [Pseudobacteriovorax antillogorgiicola]TCS48286.1 uncharacterized protein (TIGR02147 family) [Pseudobacteriovorax antillogorgiicola]SMF56948.1 TIGR02147 family protein [Pseudobacteriovorax antillogorgiicola]
MNIYVERDYRTILKQLIEEKKKIDNRASFQNLAETIRVPKSYVSKVMNGRADFSADQIFLCCHYFNLDQTESRYLDLLVEIERSALQQRKDSLAKQAEAVRKPFLNTESNIEVDSADREIESNIEDYYLNPVNLLIHQCLSIDRYRLNIALLYKDINLPPQTIDRSLQDLLRLGIVEKQGGHYKAVINNIHLSQDHKFYPVWRDQMKLLTQSSVFHTSPEENRYFSAIATFNKDGRDLLIKAFFDFINSVKSQIEPSPDDDVFQINFDFIRWTEPRS